MQHHDKFLLASEPDPCAEEFAFRVPFSQKINAEFSGPGGRRLLSGWHQSAKKKIVFFVRAANEQSARRAVLDALQQIARTQTLLIELIEQGEGFLLPLITNVPVGATWGSPKRVPLARKGRMRFVPDFIADTIDAFHRRVREIRSQIKNQQSLSL